MPWFRLLRHGMTVVVVIGVGLLGRAEKGPSSDQSGGAHRNIDCSMCHPLVASLEANAGSTMFSAGQCRSCHETVIRAGSELSGWFHRDPSRLCEDCHLFHDPARIVAGGNAFMASRSSGPASCMACHNRSGSVAVLSEGHLLAAGIYHSDEPALIGLNASQSCLLCHSENRTLQLDGHTISNLPQFDERHMHPVGEIRPGSRMRRGMAVRRDIDPRLVLFNNRIECTTCHSLTSQTKFRLVPFDQPQDLCLGCHTQF